MKLWFNVDVNEGLPPMHTGHKGLNEAAVLTHAADSAPM